jgi:predicted nucleic-acid-binding protein
MIGIDTNILLRLVLKDDPDQTEKVMLLFERLSQARPGYVNCITLMELTWYLRSRLKLGREQVSSTVSALLDTVDLVFEDEDLMEATLSRMAETTAEFADIFIALRNKRAGCAITHTFDISAAKHLAEMEPLQ